MMSICSAPAAGSDNPNPGAWWKRTGIRIFVDKVFAQRTPGQHIPADALALIRDAGFNVICPCWGAEDDARLREDAALAERNGLFYLRWMPGTLNAPEGDPYCLTWADGTVQSIYGPNAPALWAWMQERILTYAGLSKESALKGVFLDFENYAPNAQGDGYPISYDRPTLEGFASQRRMTLPDLPPGERRPWLEQKGLHEAFEQWQQARWRERARRLRKQVDDINPDFLFVVYPYPKTPFLHEIIPLWATARAPAVIASAVTYPGRQPLMHDRYVLEMRAADVRRQIAQLKARKFPFLYLGGIDPIVPGADPEFCAKNASVISRHSNGYWVFFEGPDPNSVEPERYMVWFSKANHDIESRCYRLPQLPRRMLPPPPVARKPGVHPIAITGGRRDVLFGVFGDASDFQVYILDGDTLDYLRQFDVVLIQDFKAPQELVPSLYRLLQHYVEEGGGLLLAHKTLTDFGSPFPELMAGIAKPPAGARLFQGFVEDKTMTVAGEGLEGFASGERFDLHWGPHPVLRPGPRGRVILRDAYEEPTVVIGEHGRGRVAFVAPHLGRVATPTPRQREFTLALSRWLVSRGVQ
jgi:hypothetical protein